QPTLNVISNYTMRACYLKRISMH
ncbi:hypothetical protein D046_6502B, partial [Vibrio parahaemolyticus V-223/04]